MEKSDEFQEIREIIDRYETLTTNCKDLVEIEKENEEKLNNQRKNLNSYLDVIFKTVLSNIYFGCLFKLTNWFRKKIMKY